MIGVYTICNTGSLLVHEIDYTEDMVLVSLNGGRKEWCNITYTEDGLGFMWGEMFIPFSEVMRVK